MQVKVDESATGQMAQFAASGAGWSIPDDLRELVRQHLVDTIAAIVACRDLDAAIVARRFSTTHSGTVAGGVPILGTDTRAALIDAVFASAMTGHGAEINDFCPSAFVQPGPPVVSTALCLAHQRGYGGGSVIRSIAAGYEIACRLPKAVGLGNLRRTGLATHGIAPVFGSAMTAAVLMGLAPEQVRHVLSACAQQASGSWQWLLDVEHIEKAFVFAGMGARNGVQAALLVESGFTGVRDVFDNPAGWLLREGFTGPESDLDREYLVQDLGTRWELPLVGFKRYPVGGPVQPVVQAMLELVESVDPASITSVLVEMPGRAKAFATAAMPALNIPYLCSVILADRCLGFETAQSLDRMRNDRAIRGRMTTVQVVHDPAQEAQPREESARVTVGLDNGSRRTVFVDHVRGFPSHPMSSADVQAKAVDLMTPRLGTGRAHEIVAMVWSLERMDSIAPLIELMAS